MSANNTERKIQNLLQQHRFKLVRQTKHFIYQEPGGRVFVCSATPSDWRAAERSLSILKRVIANPPQPMVVTITEFEREEAAAKIAGQERQRNARAGMGSGKQHRSRGTGFKYIDRVLTAEEIAEREKLAEVARAAAARREQHRQDRRARKLAQRAEKAEQKERVEQEFQGQCSVFLKRAQEMIEYGETRFLRTCEVIQKSRMWSTDTFYEFATDPDDKIIETAAKTYLREFVTNGLYDEEPATLEDLDLFHEKLLEEVAQAASVSAARVEKITRFIEKRLRQEPDVLSLAWDMYDEYNELSGGWSHFTGYGYACVLQLVLSQLRSLILDLLHPDESPDRLAAVICDGNVDDDPSFRVLLVGEGKDDNLGNPVRGIPDAIVDEVRSMLEEADNEVADNEVDEEAAVMDEAVVEEILALARR